MGALSAIRYAAERSWIPIERRRLAWSGHARLARALSGRPCPLAPKIERSRRELLKDRSQLVDGSLGPAGIYDMGQTVADACRVSRNGPSAQLIYSLASEYRPQTILELGTNVGISASYLAAAGGNVTTLESSPYRLRLAEKLHRSLNLHNIMYVQGLFSDTLKRTLEAMPAVELAFVDGHHQYQATLDYFEAIAVQAAPGCVFVFDDIRWSKGMRRAWKRLKSDERFEVATDLGGMGVCLLR